MERKEQRCKNIKVTSVTMTNKCRSVQHFVRHQFCLGLDSQYKTISLLILAISTTKVISCTIIRLHAILHTRYTSTCYYMPMPFVSRQSTYSTGSVFRSCSSKDVRALPASRSLKSSGKSTPVVLIVEEKMTIAIR